MLRTLALFLVVPLHMGYMCLSALVLPRNSAGDLRFRKIVKSWASTILWASKVEVKISQEDFDKLVSPESQVIVCNHQSNIDSVVLLALLPPEAHACFAAKRVLFHIPFFGRAIKRTGSVEVDRENGKQSMLRLRDQFIGAGKKSLILFPEGTRSPKGTVTPFKKGAFVLARDAEARLLPIFMSGTADVMPVAKVVPRPGTVEIRVMAPIEPGSILEEGVLTVSKSISDWMRGGYGS
jgi:1-acyl-sn-glycerol-3-phosphate acyltransferase